VAAQIRLGLSKDAEKGQLSSGIDTTNLRSVVIEFSQHAKIKLSVKMYRLLVYVFKITSRIRTGRSKYAEIDAISPGITAMKMCSVVLANCWGSEVKYGPLPTGIKYCFS
jgi:hypothetical protein